MGFLKSLANLLGAPKAASGPSIHAPSILIASVGDACHALAQQDAGIYKRYKNVTVKPFDSIVEVITTIRMQQWDILHLLIELPQNDDSGLLSGLRIAARAAHTSLLIVAQDNPFEIYQLFDKLDSERPGIALVCTLERKGDDFADYFSKLFNLMADGRSMPMAWGALTPQYPNADHPNCPSTLYMASNGQLRVLAE